MVIFLIGYMTSGKTTLGIELAKNLAVPFIDVDEYIESMEGMSVSQIFAEKGEAYFRELEHNSIKGIAACTDAVVSTGGGLPCYNGNMDLINKLGVSVYLEASEDVLVERLLVMGESRPLVRGKSRKEIVEFLSHHFRDRIKWYEMAKYTLDVDDFDENRLVIELKEMLRL